MIEVLKILLSTCDKTGIVLFNPPQFPIKSVSTETAAKRGYSTYPPSGLYHLSSAIHNVAPYLEITIVDLHLEIVRLAADGIEDIETSLKQVVVESCRGLKNPLCGISYMFGTSQEGVESLSRYLRELNAKIMIGGVQATFDYEILLRNKTADVVVHYEAEDSIQGLIGAWQEISDKEDLKNISFSDGKKIFSFPLKPPVVHPYSILPYLMSADVEAYKKYGSLSFLTKALAPEERFFALQSNRGCRGSCVFCSVRSFHGKGVVRRSVSDVVDEIRFLHEVKGVNILDWLDDDLFYDRGETIELFNEIARNFGNSVKWITSNAVIIAAMDEELLDAAVESGCIHLGFGLETGNAARLKAIRKPATLEKTRQIYALIKKKYPDLYLMANFMIGFPNETLSELFETYQFALELENDWSRISITQPLKGTLMYSAFANLGDPRTEGGMHFTLGKEMQKHGQSLKPTLDNRIFEQGLERIPTLAEIKELWYLLNANINFVYNVNLTTRGNVKKFTAMASAIADMYPYDPIIWAALNEAAKISCDTVQELNYSQRYKTSRELYPELAEAFDRYDLKRIFNAAEREKGKP